MKKPAWPKIYKVKYPSGLRGFMVDLRAVGGKRPVFPSKIEAETRAEQARVERKNEGTAASHLPLQVKLDASKAYAILSPHDVTILDAAKYYQKHVLAYKNSPPVSEIVQRYIDDRIAANKRPETIKDLRSRLGSFVEDFGESKLYEISLDEIRDWLNDDEDLEPQTRNNYRTKLAQLYNFALSCEWVDSNLIEDRIKPFAVDDKPAEIFTVDQAEQLLTHAHEFDLLPYIAIGLFAGIRKAEMFRINGRAVSFESKTVTVSAQAAKKRSQRHIPMQPALVEWLQPVKDKLQNGAPIVEQTTFFWRKNMEALKEAAGIEKWPANGLRHSFGSYHYEMFSNEHETAKQMGNSPDMVHDHYKALVLKREAEKFWALRPKVEKAEAP